MYIYIYMSFVYVTYSIYFVYRYIANIYQVYIYISVICLQEREREGERDIAHVSIYWVSIYQYISYVSIALYIYHIFYI